MSWSYSLVLNWGDYIMEDIIVQKYGGSSLETIDKIKNVAKRIIETKLL